VDLGQHLGNQVERRGGQGVRQSARVAMLFPNEAWLLRLVSPMAVEISGRIRRRSNRPGFRYRFIRASKTVHTW
jgi:hypothetical protein